MKVEQRVPPKPPFMPVTITLETPEDVHHFLDIVDGHALNDHGFTLLKLMRSALNEIKTSSQ